MTEVDASILFGCDFRVIVLDPKSFVDVPYESPMEGVISVMVHVALSTGGWVLKAPIPSALDSTKTPSTFARLIFEWVIVMREDTGLNTVFHGHEGIYHLASLK